MFYDYNVKSISGEEVSMSEYKGKVVLIVNTASKCGFTKQYEGMKSSTKNIRTKVLLS